MRDDFSSAMLETDGQMYHIDLVGAAAQELVRAGGLENWVKERLYIGYETHPSEETMTLIHNGKDGIKKGRMLQ